ncbi:MAG: SDR family oxidoreductase [Gammaproteobacteria bacterium]
MTTIVTGATGKFGRMVTDQLLEHLHPAELILTTRNPQSLAGLSARGAHVRYADFDQPESLAKAFEDGDRMLLISTLSVGRRATQHRNAIEAAVRAGVKHIAYTSSGGAHPDNPAIVIPDHLQTEDALKQSGAAFTILRDALYAEVPATEISPRALATGQWIGSAADGKVGFVAKSDCVACAAHVLTSRGHEGKTYEISGPELLSFREAAAIASQLSGKPIEYVVVSDEEMLNSLLAAGVPLHYEEGMNNIPGIGTSSATDIVSYERGIRSGYFAVKSNDVQKILGRPPQSLRQVFEANSHLLRKP